jgi:hypothetical protein
MIYFMTGQRPGASFRRPWKLAVITAASWCILLGAGILVWVLLQ